jgi:spermidine synthase
MTRRLGWAVGFLSFALLGYELSLMKLLAYVQWHHFAYMVISIALLGFGASGTALALFREWFLQRQTAALFVSTLLCVVLIALIPSALRLLSVDPFRLIADPSQLWRLLPFYLALFLPFLAGAMMVGLAFLLTPQQAGKIYFFNLVGSGLGGLAAVVAMQWLHPQEIPLAMAGFGAVGVLLLDAPTPALKKGGVAAVLLVLGWMLVDPLQPPQMSEYKSLSRTMLLPETRIVRERVSPLGVLSLVESPALRYAPGVSLQYQGAIVSRPVVFNDGEWVGAVLQENDTAALEVMKHSTAALSYELKDRARVLVLGAGTGSEMALAEALGARSVTGVEMNKALVAMVEDYGPKASGGTTIIAEARSFLARDTARYDLIVLPIGEGWTASAAGVHALFENYLLTVESFAAMIDRLAEDGVLAVQSWMNHPPRSPMKVLSTLVYALRARGVESPREHFAAVKSWGTVVALASKRGFGASDRQAIRDFCALHGFDVVYLSDMNEEEANLFHHVDRPHLFELARALVSGKEDAFFETYPFFIRPATDDRPYFSNFLRWGKVGELLEVYSLREVSLFEIGSVLLILTLVQLLVGATVLVMLPLVLVRRDRPPRRDFVRTVTYFAAIGVGYMLVEIVLIQKFILFLGDPMYSVSVVVAGMLVWSGVGSLVSGRLKDRASVVLPRIMLLLLLILAVSLLFLSDLLRALLPLDIPIRFLLALLLLAPPAFLMGFPFPLGLRLIAKGSQGLIPWAWGVNGYCSVVSATLAVVLAMELGFQAVMLVSVGAYGVALAVVRGKG